MGVEVLPTSFYTQPEPQGGVNSNVMRLLATAGEAISKRSEQDAIETEARMKAPVLARAYNDAYNRLAIGDMGGMQSLSQAGQLAAANPILTKMHEDASTMGLHVLDTYQKHQLLAEQLAGERTRAADTENKWYDQKDYETRIAEHEFDVKQQEAIDAKHAQDSDTARQLGIAPPPKPARINIRPLPSRPSRGTGGVAGSIPDLSQRSVITQKEANQKFGPDGLMITGDATNDPANTAPLPVAPSAAPAAAPAAGTPVAQGQLDPTAAAMSAAIAGPMAQSAGAAGGGIIDPAGAAMANQVAGAAATTGIGAVSSTRDGAANKPPPNTTQIQFGDSIFDVPKYGAQDTMSAKIGNVTHNVEPADKDKAKAAKLVQENVSLMENIDHTATKFISHYLTPNGKGAKFEPLPLEKGEKVPKYKLYGIDNDGNQVPYGDSLWVTKDFYDYYKEAEKAMPESGATHRFDPNGAKQIQQDKTFANVISDFKGEALTQAQAVIKKYREFDLSDPKIQKQFLVEIKSIDKDGKTHMDLPKGMKGLTEGEPAKHPLTQEASDVQQQIQSLTEQINSGKETRKMTNFNLPQYSHDETQSKTLTEPRKDELKKQLTALRKKYRSLGFDPDTL